jgi:hypothetical protein
MNTTKVILLSAIVLLTACEKEHTTKLKLEQSTTVGSVTKSSWSVNWNAFTHGTTYTAAQATECFGNVTGWNDTRTYISNGTCRIALQPNATAAADGIVANVKIAEGREYEVDYDVRFHSQFDWGKGGKLGFGFAIGESSAKVIWYETETGSIVFQPYIGTETFGKAYPASGSLNKGDWYHVHLYVKSNTGSNTDGQVLLAVNGTTVLDKAMQWTTDNSLISKLTFHTYRGCDKQYYESETVDYIYYDNLKVHKIN